MTTEKKQTLTNGQGPVKRLSLDDFKLEKISHLEVVTAKSLSNVVGGMEDPGSLFNCPIPYPMDDCHD
jgi:hypothetical protein